MTKRILTIGAGLLGLLFLLAGTPWGLEAQTTIRNSTVTLRDGVTATVAATVFDQTNSNPSAVAVVDSNGDPVDVADGGSGAPTSATTRIINASLPLPYRSIDLDESEEEADDDAGELCGVWFTNAATATRWLKFYNADADDVTVGTTAPVITIGLPGNTSDDISGALGLSNGCVQFSTAMTVAATTGIADNDTGAPSANDVTVIIFRR